MRMSPMKKTLMTKWLKKEMRKKAMESTKASQCCAAGDGRHDFLAGFADELADGNDLVAVGAEGLDEDGQGGDGGGAVAAAVVHAG